MARRQIPSLPSSLFWPAMTLLAALIAGGVFAYVFAKIGGNGWRQGAGVGLVVFLVAAFLFGRKMTGEPPPPKSAELEVPPAPTVPRDAEVPGRAERPDAATAARAEEATEAAEAASPAVHRVREAEEHDAERPSAPGAGRGAALETRETPTTSARVTDAARKAAEAARAMAEPVAEPAPATRPAQPQGLAAAREGGPDDLKKIKGIGPKIEELLNSLGYYHFDQLAAWGSGEIAWADSSLEAFNGRATRDDWVGQARILASGGQTEFSERVAKGGVYDE